MTNVWNRKMTDYFNVVTQLMKDNPETKIYNIFQMATRHPAHAFYTELGTARRFISLMNRGKKLPLKNKNKIEMYNEIYRRFCELRDQRDKEGLCQMTFSETVALILDSPAPQFYEDVETMRCAFYRFWRTKRKLNREKNENRQKYVSSVNGARYCQAS